MKKTVPPTSQRTSQPSNGSNLKLRRTTLRRLTLSDLSKVGAGQRNLPATTNTAPTTGLYDQCNTITRP